MAAAIAHELTWVAAAPLWRDLVKDRTRMRRPALLRFTSDAFMEELFAQLASKPEELASRVAAREAGQDALKLYQPVHGQFHLVAASLVCQIPGLPDHAVDTTKEEKASFVLRRLAGDRELAWIPSADPTKPGRWQVTADKEKLEDGEELLPLFPGSFVEQKGHHKRRLFFGLVPTSSQETFRAAEVTDPARVGDDGETVLKSSDSGNTLVPKLGARAGALYAIRCVYRKPRCEPKEPALLSDPSERFSIAGYFDPDAPARNIRIPMPGIRNPPGKNNVALLLPQELAKMLDDAMAGIRGKLKLDPPPDPGCGTISIPSFSIPALTIIAMILIMIVMILLSLIGFALNLRFCLPFSLKAKD